MGARSFKLHVWWFFTFVNLRGRWIHSTQFYKINLEKKIIRKMMPPNDQYVSNVSREIDIAVPASLQYFQFLISFKTHQIKQIPDDFVCTYVTARAYQLNLLTKCVINIS